MAEIIDEPVLSKLFYGHFLSQSKLEISPSNVERTSIAANDLARARILSCKMERELSSRRKCPKPL
jgi:hypothetical protein